VHQSQAGQKDELQPDDHLPADNAPRLEVMGQEDDPTRSQGQGHKISSPTKDMAQEAGPPAADCARRDVEQADEGEDSQSQQKKAQDLSLTRVQADIPAFQVCPIGGFACHCPISDIAASWPVLQAAVFSGSLESAGEPLCL
jgi:hypothetical protein